MANNNPNLERFLHYISQLESSGGQNLNHKPVKDGLQAGDVAEGQYGMMPNTIDEMSARNPSHPPKTSDEAAQQLGNMVLDKANNDETLAAGLWKFGQNTPESKYPDVRNKDYAQAYDSMRKEIPYSLDPNPYNQPKFFNLKESLKNKK